MKVSPVAQGAVPSVNPGEGRSASAERVARAVAVASGQEPEQAKPVQAPEAEQPGIRRIKMKTQRSTTQPMPVEAATPAAPAQPIAKVDNVDPVEQVQTPEAASGLTPQAAAVAKAKRDLQLERKAFEVEKAELAKARESQAGAFTKDQIKANALAILRDAGVTNEQLTEAILAEASDFGPGYTKLEQQMKAMQAKLDAQTAALAERDKTSETQVLTQIRKNVDSLIASGDEFEAIRETGHAPKVVELIHKVFQKTGEILDEAEAAKLVEEQLVEDRVDELKRLKKVQSRLSPAPEQPAAPKQVAPNTKVMRTLTNRDGSSGVSLSRRERAIAAAEGRLKS